MNSGFLIGAIAFVIAGCSVGQVPTSSPVIPPTTSSAVDTPGPTVSETRTASPTPTPEPTYGPCPTGSPLTVREFVTADPACFGAADLVIRGWLDTPPALGFEPPAIEPGWLYYPADNAPTLFNAQPTDPDHICSDGAPECPWFFPHLNPVSGLTFGEQPRWLLVTGHLADAAAEKCHFVYPEDWPYLHYDDQDAVNQCRGSFVAVSFRNAP